MAYKLLYGGQYLHDPYTGESVTDASLTAQTNNADYMDFTIHYGHSLYDTVAENASTVELYWDKVKLFEGVIESIETDIEGSKAISCKGGLSYLEDTIVRAYSTVEGEQPVTAPSSPVGLFQWYIDQHNRFCDSKKRFNVGENQANMLDTNAYIYRSSSQNPTTWSEISSKLIDELGGYVEVQYTEPRTISYYADVHSTNAQIIDFGVNITDFSKTVDTAEQYTAIYAQGATPDAEGDETTYPIDLTSLPDGTTSYSSDFFKDGDHVYSVSGVARYGYREYAYSNTDCTTADGLLESACKALSNLLSPDLSITVKAVDLALYMDGYDHLRAGQAVRVRSKFHDVDEYLMVSSISLDLNDPSQTTYELGASYQTLTGQQSTYLKNLNANTNKALDTATALSAETKAAAQEAKDAREEAATATATAETASSDASAAKEAASKAVVSTTTEYATNQDPATAPTEGWSADQPEWTAGNYIWMRQTVTYGDASTETTEPACITGNQGEQGAAGEKGDKGDKGDTGATGAKGEDGASFAWNMLRGSANLKSTTAGGYGWYPNTKGGSVALVMEDGVQCFKATRPENTESYVPSTACNWVELEWGQTYTVSGEIKVCGQDFQSTTKTPWHYHFRATAKNDPLDAGDGKDLAGVTCVKRTVFMSADTWYPYELRIVVPDETPDESKPYAMFRPFLYGGDNATPKRTNYTEAWIRNVKVEKGTTATPWCTTQAETVGKNGVSPTVTTKQTDTGATITITDATGTKTATVTNGAKGDKGDQGTDGASVTSVKMEYAQGDSSTTAPTSGWQDAVPDWQTGKYIWQRSITTITAADGTATTQTGDAVLYGVMNSLATDVAGNASKITQTADALGVEFTDEGAVSTLIRETSEGIEVGKSEDGSTYTGTHTVVGTDAFSIHDKDHNELASFDATGTHLLKGALDFTAHDSKVGSSTYQYGGIEGTSAIKSLNMTIGQTTSPIQNASVSVMRGPSLASSNNPIAQLQAQYNGGTTATTHQASVGVGAGSSSSQIALTADSVTVNAGNIYGETVLFDNASQAMSGAIALNQDCTTFKRLRVICKDEGGRTFTTWCEAPAVGSTFVGEITIAVPSASRLGLKSKSFQITKATEIGTYYQSWSGYQTGQWFSNTGWESGDFINIVKVVGYR